MPVRRWRSQISRLPAPSDRARESWPVVLMTSLRFWRLAKIIADDTCSGLVALTAYTGLVPKEQFSGFSPAVTLIGGQLRFIGKLRPTGLSDWKLALLHWALTRKQRASLYSVPG
jgi:hypothetical protein